MEPNAGDESRDQNDGWNQGDNDQTILKDDIFQQFVAPSYAPASRDLLDGSAHGLDAPSAVPLDLQMGSSYYANDIDRLLLHNQYVSAEEDFLDSLGDTTYKKPDEMKLIRRLEMCARAREESTKIMSLRCAQRHTVKEDMLREKKQLEELESATRKERFDRWTHKTQKSPFNVDLVAQQQRLDEESRVRDQLEARKQKIAAKREKEASEAILKRQALANDELHALRKEKRQLLTNEKRLKAMRDLEKSNARTEMILQQRRQKALELVKQRNKQV